MPEIILSYLAGVVSILSPCVLPLVPMILGGSLNAHRKGPLLLVTGLVLSFAGFGLLITTIGLSIGLTPWVLQNIAANGMIIFGLALYSTKLQGMFSAAASQLTCRLNNKAAAVDVSGLYGQFILGLLLGAIWTPCIGPTLGAAISLASQGQDVAYAGLIMLFFSIGVATPILALAYGSQHLLQRRKEALAKTAHWLKPALGILFIVVGLMVLTGVDKTIETAVLGIMPAGLINFLYSF